jgi:hypothetical protein
MGQKAKIERRLVEATHRTDILGAWLLRRLFTIDLQYSSGPQRTLAVTTRMADDKGDHNGCCDHESGIVLMRRIHVHTSRSFLRTVGLPLSQEKSQSRCEECHATRLPRTMETVVYKRESHCRIPYRSELASRLLEFAGNSQISLQYRGNTSPIVVQAWKFAIGGEELRP